MPSVVPAPLASIAEQLQCPVCRPAAGDPPAMVAARAALQEAGHFAALTAALAAEALPVDSGPAPVVLDLGGGTGHHLAGVLDGLARARGISLDASAAASRRAAHAHPRIAAVRADVWRHIPLGDAAVDLALSVFAPRNASELARVLRPGAALIVATPTQEHLRELTPLHRMHVDPAKAERLHRQLAPALRLSSFRVIGWTLRITRDEAQGLVRMGPAARHLRPDVNRRLDLLPEPMLVTGGVELRTFHPRAPHSAEALRNRRRRSAVASSELRAATLRPSNSSMFRIR